MKTLAAILLTALPYWLLDGLWLGLISKNFYRKYLGYLMGTDFVWAPALVFYALYPLAVYFFVVQPALAGNLSIPAIALRGALFGLATYATYDLTNQATIKNWPFIVTFVDLAWGTFAVAVVAVIGSLLARHFLA